jgi:hypothetical protein
LFFSQLKNYVLHKYFIKPSKTSTQLFFFNLKNYVLHKYFVKPPKTSTQLYFSKLKNYVLYKYFIKPPKVSTQLFFFNLKKYVLYKYFIKPPKKIFIKMFYLNCKRYINEDYFTKLPKMSRHLFFSNLKKHVLHKSLNQIFDLNYKTYLNNHYPKLLSLTKKYDLINYYKKYIYIQPPKKISIQMFYLNCKINIYKHFLNYIEKQIRLTINKIIDYTDIKLCGMPLYEQYILLYLKYILKCFGNVKKHHTFIFSFYKKKPIFIYNSKFNYPFEFNLFIKNQFFSKELFYFPYLNIPIINFFFYQAYDFYNSFNFSQYDTSSIQNYVRSFNNHYHLLKLIPNFQDLSQNISKFYILSQDKKNIKKEISFLENNLQILTKKNQNNYKLFYNPQNFKPNLFFLIYKNKSKF